MESKTFREDKLIIIQLKWPPVKRSWFCSDSSNSLRWTVHGFDSTDYCFHKFSRVKCLVLGSFRNLFLDFLAYNYGGAIATLMWKKYFYGLELSPVFPVGTRPFANINVFCYRCIYYPVYILAKRELRSRPIYSMREAHASSRFSDYISGIFLVFWIKEFLMWNLLIVIFFLLVCN